MDEGVEPLPSGRSALRWLTHRRRGARTLEIAAPRRDGDEAEGEPSTAMRFLLDLIGIAICAYVVWEGAELLISTVGH